MMKYPNRSMQPNINLVDSINLKQPEVRSLKNGIPVYLIDASSQDILKLEFSFKAGSWYEKKKLTAGFTSRMLKEGSKKFSAMEIADKIDYYGAILDIVSDKDMSSVSLYTLNKYIENILPVLTEVIQAPVFPQYELDIMKQNRKQHFLVNNEKVKYLAKRKFNELIFGSDHPYGKVFREADFDDIKKSDLEQFHRQFYNPQNCTIIVSGKIPVNIVDLLNVFFGWKWSGDFIPGVQSNNQPLHTIGKNEHIHKSNAVQTAIRIGKVMFNKTHPDYLKLKVLNTILGGYFGSRLMTNIREDKGYTYGIGSAIAPLHRSGYFFIASEVGSEVAEKAIDEIYIEIDKLRQDKVTERELSIVKNYMMGSFLRSVDGAFALADHLKGIIEYGLDYGFFDRYVEVIKTIGPVEIRDLAQCYFADESLSQLTVGP
ncbi:MAG: M16 family metallopeptidase [Bacteroidales bacterium]